MIKLFLQLVAAILLLLSRHSIQVGIAVTDAPVLLKSLTLRLMELESISNH
jgi:hypothetical protein